jgi:hypothetical protein
VTIDLHRATAPKIVNHRLSSASDINLGGDTKARFGFKKKKKRAERQSRKRESHSHDSQTPQKLRAGVLTFPSSPSSG